MKAEVIDIRFTKSSRTTRAFADIFIEGITIRDFRICQKKDDGKPSVRNPFTTIKDADGVIRFRQLINLPPNVEAEVDALILGEYFRRLKESQHETKQDLQR